MSTPTAPGALVFTSEYRSVRRARRGTLGKNGIGGRAFVEHLDAKLGRNLLQSRRESVQLEQVERLGQSVTAAAYLEYAQAQRFDPPDEVPYAGAGEAQSPAKPLAGVKPAVGQLAKQRKKGCAHAQKSREKPGQILAPGEGCAGIVNKSRRTVFTFHFRQIVHRSFGLGKQKKIHQLVPPRVG